MTQEVYSIEQKRLVLRDSELALEVDQPFDLPQARTFYPEGNLQAVQFYAQGYLHGPSTYYALSGEILSQTWYLGGKKVGKAKYFYKSGQLYSLQRFLLGQPQGLQEYWYEDGRVRTLLPYQAGQLHGEVQLYWENGVLKRSVSYVEGKRHGWDRMWDERSMLIDEGEFAGGQPVGLHRRYFASGQLREELLYHTPLRLDRKEWNAQGKPQMEGIWAADLTYTERVFLEPHGAKVKRGYWDGQRLCWK